MASALLASAVVATLEVPAPRFALAGLVLSLTPVVLFIIGSVNPSAIEIAGAILLWVSGAILVRERRSGSTRGW
ncbi:MAG: DUF2142 domain-containing protein [Acidimicrobiia bacterium]|nr:DUF2142 domain-containing protein [Acidimicrobiia bacterium]